ncbi:hypothetical protein Taro_006458, partial [Colocasia esculenta]|nr:hypothetical protein [Colocasia esculenta]
APIRASAWARANPSRTPPTCSTSFQIVLHSRLLQLCFCLLFAFLLLLLEFLTELACQPSPALVALPLHASSTRRQQQQQTTPPRDPRRNPDIVFLARTRKPGQLYGLSGKYLIESIAVLI